MLDQLIEFDMITGKRVDTPLNEPIRLRLQAQTEPGIVMQAAQTWCATVVQAKQGSAAMPAAEHGQPGRIT